MLKAGLLAFSVLHLHSYVPAGFGIVVLALIPFYASFERRRPQARELVPIAVLAAVAALGRVIFAPFPNIKPTSSIVIVAGLSFGPWAGFMTGATAALTSNIFFGQGPFTPWQMFAWGMMGFAAGLFSKSRMRRFLPFLLVFGFVWGFLYGWIMDLYQALAFVSPLSLAGLLLTFGASFYFDACHAISNVVFRLRLLERVKLKYGLMESD